MYTGEVTVINKKKFLSELSKLLTFMYEEDRLTALDMYERMFGEAGDEQALLRILVSPTRQAVVVARAYNAKERKLHVHSQSGRDADIYSGETPDFVDAINAIRREATEQDIFSEPVDDNQFSIFDDILLPEEDSGSTLLTPIREEPAEEAVSEERAEDSEAEDKKVETYSYETAPADDLKGEMAETGSSEDNIADKDSAVSEDGSGGEDEVDSFMKDFSIDDGKISEPGDEGEADSFVKDFSINDDKISESGYEEKTENGKKVNVPVCSEAKDPELKTKKSKKKKPTPSAGDESRTQRKPRAFLLFLYITAAVVVIPVGVALLMIPAFLFLGLSLGSVAVGIVTFSAAFGGGLSIFADVLIVIGVALVILALGLLFLWLFIWFIGAVIVGFINGIIGLAGKWCYKEVKA